MKNYTIYKNLKCEVKKKKLELLDLKKKSNDLNIEIEALEIGIEEDMNGLNMIFDHIISQKRKL